MLAWRFGMGAIAMIGLTACAERCLDPGSRSGATLFQLHCASCHGVDARGNGPVAEFISVRVPDLTKLASQHGGKFLDEEVYRIIDGQSQRRAHGTRHMPVWGNEFYGQQGDDEQAHQEANEKVASLVSYLRTLQQPGP